MVVSSRVMTSTAAGGGGGGGDTLPVNTVAGRGAGTRVEPGRVGAVGWSSRVLLAL